jgi:Cellulase (glycosyl hydrolase family 5)
MTTFSIVGKRIYDPDGSEFIPRGFNLAGWGYVHWAQLWGNVYIDGSLRVISGLPRDAIPYLKAWGINTIRLHCDIFTAVTRGGDFATPMMTRIDDAVQNLTDEGIVCILEYSHFINGKPAGGMLTNATNPTLDQVISKGVEFANLYKDNPYVWLEPMNEPGTGQAPTTTLLDQWVYTYQKYIKAVRDTGANNIILCNGLSWGQDGSSWDTSPVVTGRSAILSRGSQLLSFRDPDNNFASAVNYSNILFGFHAYEQWGHDDLPFTQEQWTQKMRNYVARVQDLGLALIIGEFGNWNNYHTEFATQATYTISKEKRIGALYWDYYGRGIKPTGGGGLCFRQTMYNTSLGYDVGLEAGYFINKLDGTKPTNLYSSPYKYNGNDLWEWLRYWDDSLYKSNLIIGGTNYFGKIHTVLGLSKALPATSIRKLSDFIYNIQLPSDSSPYPINEYLVLREDEDYLLREDGTYILTEDSEILYSSLLREDGDFILREDDTYLLREDTIGIAALGVLREDNTFLLREDSSYIYREDTF